MRYLLVALTMTTLLAAPVAAQGVQAESSAQATVIFYASAPSAGGRAIAVTTIESSATAEMQQATYANLRVRSASFVFAVARTAAAGEAVGQTLVRLNGTARTLASLAADLQAGFAGTTAVLVFTNGSAQQGVAVTVVNVSKVTASTTVDISGATHVTLVAEGQVQSFAIVKSGTTLGTITITASGEAQTSLGATAGNGVATVVDVLVKIGIEVKIGP